MSEGGRSVREEQDLEPVRETQEQQAADAQVPVQRAQQAGSPETAGLPSTPITQLPEPRDAQSPPEQSVSTDQQPELSEVPEPRSGLSDRDRAVLLFEKQYWKHVGAKEQAIRDRFGLSATRYYQLLNALLDRTEALEFEPVLIKRLRRQRSARARSRSGSAR
jgi:hypothetical protein